jgi:ATP/maltotriose-dependent transcriptional regulator MalT
MADFTRSESLYDRALTDATPPKTRLQVLLDRSWISILQGRWGQAQEDFDNAMAMAREPLDPDLLKSLVYHLGPGLIVLPGGIDHIERICHLALAQVGEQISPIRAQIEGLMALVHGWRGRWLKALELGRHVVAVEKRLGGQPFIGHDAAAIVIAACGAIGNYALADVYFDLLFQGVKHMEFADLYMSAFLFVPGRVLWMQGRIEEAERVYEQMLDAKNPRELPLAQVVRAWMRALLDAEAGKAAQAEKVLRQPLVLEQTDRVSSAWGSTRLILARLYLKQGRQQEALRELDIVLPQYERMGVLGGLAIEGASIVPLLQLAVEKGVQAPFASRLLELLGAGAPPQPIELPATGQTLTRREVEVLRLISVGASNQDIADRLVISMSTVKAHVSHILTKLDVSNRTQAASRVREWRLLSSSGLEELDRK